MDNCRHISQFCYRDSLVNLYKLTKNSLYLTLMKRQRNIVNSLIETAKKEYISRLLENNSSCPKKFWKYINQFLKGEYGKYQHPIFLDPSTGTTVITGNEPAFLNDYFVNISSRLGFGPDYPLDFENNNYLDMMTFFIYLQIFLPMMELYYILVILISLKVAVKTVLPL